MSYTPKVGDRVQLPAWASDYRLDVEYVGSMYLIGTDSSGTEACFLLGRDWIKVERRPELPEMPVLWAPIVEMPDGELVRLAALSGTAAAALDYNDSTTVAIKYVPDMDSIVWADGVQS